MALVFGTSSLYSGLQCVPTQMKARSPPAPTKSPSIDHGCHTSQNRVTSPPVVLAASAEPQSQTVSNKATSRLSTFMDDLMPGTSMEILSVTYQIFEDKLKPLLQTNQALRQIHVLYIYFANQQLLIIMSPSDTHEDTIHGVGDSVKAYIDQICAIVGTDEFRDMLVIGANTSTFYSNSLDEFTADLTINMDVVSLFHHEVVYTQKWEAALDKIARILTDESTWGVLVLRIEESPVWEMPGGAPMDGDEMSYSSWVQQCQRTDGFGRISVRERLWIGDIACAVYLFPSDWDRTQEIPQSFSLPAQGPLNFNALDGMLDKVWRDVIRCVLLEINREEVMEDLPTFQMSWDVIRSKIHRSMLKTGYQRYIRWYRKRGSGSLKQPRAYSPPPSHRPKKRTKM